jgi:ribosomal protein S18 acetylase RimI-like enzyme
MHSTLPLFQKTGKMALGSRLRLLTATVTDDAAEIYRLYGVEFSPKWFPVFFVLADSDSGSGSDSAPNPKSITEIAQLIGHSQPSVSKIVQEMIQAGLVQERERPLNERGTTVERPLDKRRTSVELTLEGAALSAQIRVQCGDVDAAIQGIIDEARHNLWEAIAEWEYLLQRKSLLQRVRDQKKLRESRLVQIVDYESRYQPVFKALNVEWISTHFQMEEADYKALDHPEEHILAKGGRIFVALYEGEPVGVCALMKMDDPDYDYELAKMAVSPKAKGKSIGWLLGQAVVAAATEAGASKLYLESNTSLKPAINLYEKLGFRKVVGRNTPYARCNIQMELDLSQP